jgi:uncharacterized membrane protein YtjA (UPF0391 family)
MMFLMEVLLLLLPQDNARAAPALRHPKKFVRCGTECADTVIGMTERNAASDYPASSNNKRHQRRDINNANQKRVIRRSFAMLGWAVTFLVIALIAAVLGFGGIAGFAVELAKIVFFVAIVLFVLSAIFGLVRGRSPTL